MRNKKPSMPTGSSREDIGRRLKATRIALGLRGVDICNELCMKASTYSTNENGIYIPNIADMTRYAERYGVTLDWIYRGKMDGLPYALVLKIQEAMDR